MKGGLLPFTHHKMALKSSEPHPQREFRGKGTETGSIFLNRPSVELKLFEGQGGV